MLSEVALLTNGNGKPYLRVHIPSSFGHAHSRAQPLAWTVTLSAAGGEVDGGQFGNLVTMGVGVTIKF